MSLRPHPRPPGHLLAGRRRRFCGHVDGRPHLQASVGIATFALAHGPHPAGCAHPLGRPRASFCRQHVAEAEAGPVGDRRGGRSDDGLCHPPGYGHRRGQRRCHLPVGGRVQSQQSAPHIREDRLADDQPAGGGLRHGVGAHRGLWGGRDAARLRRRWPHLPPRDRPPDDGCAVVLRGPRRRRLCGWPRRSHRPADPARRGPGGEPWASDLRPDRPPRHRARRAGRRRPAGDGPPVARLPARRPGRRPAAPARRRRRLDDTPRPVLGLRPLPRGPGQEAVAHVEPHQWHDRPRPPPGRPSVEPLEHALHPGRRHGPGGGGLRRWLPGSVHAAAARRPGRLSGGHAGGGGRRPGGARRPAPRAALHLGGGLQSPARSRRHGGRGHL